MTEINNPDLIVPVGELTFGIGSKYEVLTLVRLQLFTQEAQSMEGCLQGRAVFASFSLILSLLLKCSSEELAAIAVSRVAMQGSEEGHCNATCMSYQSLQSLPRGDLVPPNLCSAVLLCLIQSPWLSPSVGRKTSKDWDREEYFAVGLSMETSPWSSQPGSHLLTASAVALLPHSYHFSSLKTRLQDWRAGARAEDRGWLDGPLSFCLGPA